MNAKDIKEFTKIAQDLVKDLDPKELKGFGEGLRLKSIDWALKTETNKLEGS